MSKIVSFLNKLSIGVRAFPSFLLIQTNALLLFFKNAYKELDTVTWLTGKETVKYGVYVLIFIIITTGFIAAVDLAFFEMLALFTA